MNEAECTVTDAPRPTGLREAAVESAKLMAGKRAGIGIPCVLPYGDLPIEQKQKDFIFAAIVKSFWTAGGNALASKAAG